MKLFQGDHNHPAEFAEDLGKQGQEKSWHGNQQVTDSPEKNC